MKTDIQTLPTVRQAFAKDSAYWGDNAEWLIAYSTTRDADCLGRSNWAEFIKALGGKGTEGAKGTQEIIEGKLAIEEASHWACGWVQYLVISPDAADLIAKATELRAKLENYPVLNEEAFSQLENDEYYTFFKRDAASEFRRELKDYALSDLAVDRICDADPDKLIEWFESQIPSGEYQTDGYPCFSLAFRDLERADLAALCRAIRTK